MLITEVDLRVKFHKDPFKVLNVSEDVIITPAAWQFLHDRFIQVISATTGTKLINPALGGGFNAGVPSRTDRSLIVESYPTDSASKPEDKTHLNARLLVSKTHPRIALRGELDLLQCQIIQTQVLAQQEDEGQLLQELEEVARWARGIMTAEVKEQPFIFGTLLEMDEAQIREHSHHPERYYDLKHTLPNYRQGLIVSQLNLLRAQARKCELAAVRAFTASKKERIDIIQALNRLSSLFYILVCRQLQSVQKEKKAQPGHQEPQPFPKKVELGFVPIGVSNRHIHLDQKTLEQLFGTNYTLNPAKFLSQPGQFAAQETVTLSGPKGKLTNVRVLGPVRQEIQIEISVTDAYVLGVPIFVRDSGDLLGTPGIEIIGPRGSMTVKQGVVVPTRHLHCTPADAAHWSLKDGEKVRAQIEGSCRIEFDNVLVRVRSDFQTELHLTTDEGNAAAITQGAQARIMKVFA